MQSPPRPSGQGLSRHGAQPGGPTDGGPRTPPAQPYQQYYTHPSSSTSAVRTPPRAHDANVVLGRYTPRQSKSPPPPVQSSPSNAPTTGSVQSYRSSQPVPLHHSLAQPLTVQSTQRAPTHHNPVTVGLDRRAGPLVTSTQRTSEIAAVGTFVVSDVIRHVASIPQLRQVWTAEDGGWVRVRDPTTGDLLFQTLVKASKDITALCASSDAGSVWCGHAEGTLHVFSTSTKAAVAELVLHQAAISGLVSTSASDLLLSCSLDGRVAGWSRRSFRCVWATTLAPSSNGSAVPMQCMALDEPKGVAYVGGNDGFVRAIDIRDGTVINGLTIPVCTSGSEGAIAITAMHFVATQNQLWVGCADGKISVWSLPGASTGAQASCVSVLSEHKTGIRFLVGCAGDNKVWSTSLDGFAVVFDDVSLAPLQHLPICSSNFRSNRTSQDVTTVLVPIMSARVWRLWSCSSDGTVRSWMSQCLVSGTDEPSASMAPPTEPVTNYRAESEIRLLTTKVDELNEEVRRHRSKAAEYEEKISRLNGALAVMPPAPPPPDAALLARLEAQERVIAEKTATIAEKSAQINDLQLSLHQTSQRRSLSPPRDSSRAAMASLVAEKEALESRLRSMTLDHTAILNGTRMELDQERQRSASLESKVRELNYQLDSASGIKTDLENERRAKEATEAKVRSAVMDHGAAMMQMKMELDQSKEHSANLEAKLRAAVADLDAVTTLKSELEQERARREALDGKLRNVALEHGAAMMAAKLEFEQERQRKEELQQQVQNLELTASRLQRDVYRTAALAGASDQQQQQMREMIDELSKIAGELAERDQDLLRLRQQQRHEREQYDRAKVQSTEEWTLKIDLLREEYQRDVGRLRQDLDHQTVQMQREKETSADHLREQLEWQKKKLLQERDASIIVLQTRISELETTAERQDDELRHWKQRLQKDDEQWQEKLKGERRDTVDEMTQLKKEFRAAALQQQQEHLAAEEHLRSELQRQHATEMQAANAQITGLANDLEKVVAERDRIRNICDNERAENARQKERMEEETSRQLENVRQEAKDLSEFLKRSNDERDMQYEQSMKELEERHLAKRQQEEQRAQAEMTLLKKKHQEDMDYLQQELARWKEEADVQERRRAELLQKQEESFLERKATDERRFAGEMAAVRNELTQLKEESLKAETKWQTDRTALTEKIQAQQQDRAKLVESFAEREEELKTTKEALQQAMVRHEEIKEGLVKAHTAKVQQLTSALETHEAQEEELKKVLQDTESVLQKVSKAKEDADTVIRQQQQEVMNTKQALEITDQQCRGHQQAAAAADERSERLEKRYRQIQEDFVRVETEAREKDQSRMEKERVIQEQTIILREHDNKVRSLEDELKGSRGEVAKLQEWGQQKSDEVTRLNQSLVSVAMRVRQLEEEKNRAEHDLQKQSLRVSELEEVVERRTKILADTAEHQRETDQKVTEAYKELEQEKRERGIVAGRLQMATGELDTIKRQLADVMIARKEREDEMFAGRVETEKRLSELQHDLQEAFREFDTEKEKMTKEWLAKLNQEREKAREDMQLKSEEAFKLSSELSTIAAKCAQLQEELQRERKVKDTLSADLGSAVSQLGEMSVQHSRDQQEWNQKLFEAQDHAKRAERQFQSINQEKLDMMESHEQVVTRLRSEMTNKLATIEDLQRQKDVLEHAAKRQLALVHSEMGMMDAEVSSLQRQLQEGVGFSEKMMLQSENADLKTQISVLQRDLAQKRVDLKDLQSRLVDAEGKGELALKTEQQQNLQLQAEVERMKQQLRWKQHEAGSLEKRLDDKELDFLSKSKLQQKQLQDQITALEQQLEQAMREQKRKESDTQSTLHDWEVRSQEWKTQQKSERLGWEQEREELKSNVASLQRELKNKTQEAMSMLKSTDVSEQALWAKMKQENANLDSQVRELTEQLHRVQLQLKQKAVEFSEFRQSEHDRTDDMQQKWRQEKAGLEKGLFEAEQIAISVQRELRAKVGELMTAKQMLEDSETHGSTKLKAQLRHAEDESRMARDQLASTLLELKSVNGHLTQVKQTMDAQERILKENFKVEKVEMEEKLLSVERQLRTLESAVNARERQVSFLETELRALQAKYNDESISRQQCVTALEARREENEHLLIEMERAKKVKGELLVKTRHEEAVVSELQMRLEEVYAELQAKRQEAESLKDRLGHVESSSQSTQDQLASENKKMKQQCEVLQALVEELRLQSKELAFRNEEASQHAISSKNKEQSLAEQLRQTQQQVLQYKQDVENSHQELRSLDQKLMETAEALKKAVREKQHEGGRLAQELEQSRRKVAGLEENLLVMEERMLNMPQPQPVQVMSRYDMGYVERQTAAIAQLLTRGTDRPDCVSRASSAVDELLNYLSAMKEAPGSQPLRIAPQPVSPSTPLYSTHRSFAATGPQPIAHDVVTPSSTTTRRQMVTPGQPQQWM